MAQNQMDNGFRSFRLTAKTKESDIIASFNLQPQDGAPVWGVKPGQYITLRVPAADGSVLKTYSVSSDPAQIDGYRITVKREAGIDGAPDGVGSCWLHDTLQVGDTIDVAAPRGVFFLDEESTRPVVLLSGGVGLTPMVSMLHRLKDSDRDVYFLHACENGQVHALRDEVSSLANDRIKPLFVYRAPSQADQATSSFDAAGFIDKAFLQTHLPLDDYDVYLCGPTPFMIAMYEVLQTVGVPKTRIAYEFFGKGGSLDRLAQKPKPSMAAVDAAPTLQALTFLTNPDAWASDGEQSAEKPTVSQGEVSLQEHVTFQKSGTSAAWSDNAGSLLELAESAGLAPDFSCREGICGACACTLLSGEVDYSHDLLEAPDEGEVLICCARPKGPVVLDI